MKTIDRRSFVSLISRSVITSAFLPALPLPTLAASAVETFDSCWLDVCAPLLVQDPGLGVESEIILTADNFVGASGHSDRQDLTEYEFYLYDAFGKAVGPDGVARRLSVPAMHTTVVPLSELVGLGNKFWGGLRIRLRPKTRTPTHASDLFSSVFVRWRTKDSFTNVHANPDPLQWQRQDSFFYSMPFPSLRNYDCAYSLFNPYAQRSEGSLVVYDCFGSMLHDRQFQLEPHSSLLFDVREGNFSQDADDLFATRRLSSRSHARKEVGALGGTVAVVNRQGSVKNFGYMLIKQNDNARFSVEHPIHQPPFNPLPSTAAFDNEGRLKAKNVLYTPLVFVGKKIGGVTLTSRFHLSSGAPMEQLLRMRPFITDEKGDVVWQASEDSGFPQSISQRQIERGVIRLAAYQSCIFDCKQVNLPKGFSGGFSLAVTPTTNHTLMKVEIVVSEWNASAFTHFRPGLAAARSYQKPRPRAGLATDYIASSARVDIKSGKISRDEIIAIINVDDKNIPGNPRLEVFSSKGLLTTVKLGQVPAYGCKHYLLSGLLSEKIGANDLTLRLVDEDATLLMSIIHLDYDRRDLALDHGSDRFSTFSEFTCDVKT